MSRVDKTTGLIAPKRSIAPLKKIELTIKVADLAFYDEVKKTGMWNRVNLFYTGCFNNYYISSCASLFNTSTFRK